MTGTLVCDLDGVVYLGDQAIPGSADALEDLVSDGWTILFCTNNSSRTRDGTAHKIMTVTGFPATPDQVITSAVSAIDLIRDDQSPIFVLGGAGIVDEAQRRGLPTTDDPAEAAVVVVGLDPDLSYSRLSGAVLAVRGGARLIATNHDPTYPTPRGLLPGAGAIVAAVETATETRAEVAGKPHAAMREAVRRRTHGRVVLVGDRVDTDIEMGLAEDWEAILVETGVTPAGTADGEDRYSVLPSLAQVPDWIRRTRRR